mmetsp:Transcript_22715/g.58187  ORF Transcript_22715/g.58187 Transcript_22715/m.58187 type:complete len:205 (+) Transcript_22715:3404-4018(+)
MGAPAWSTSALHSARVEGWATDTFPSSRATMPGDCSSARMRSYGRYGGLSTSACSAASMLRSTSATTLALRISNGSLASMSRACLRASSQPAGVARTKAAQAAKCCEGAAQTMASSSWQLRTSAPGSRSASAAMRNALSNLSGGAAVLSSLSTMPSPTSAATYCCTSKESSRARTEPGDSTCPLCRRARRQPENASRVAEDEAS